MISEMFSIPIPEFNNKRINEDSKVAFDRPNNPEQV